MDVDEFLAQVRAEHRLHLNESHCWSDDEPWPCPTERLARAVEAVRDLGHDECTPIYRDDISAAIAEHLQ